jgi:glutamyl-tRNA synthetase
VRAVVAAAGDRLKVAGDILNFEEFFLQDDKFPYDEKSFEKYIHKDDSVELLKKFKEQLAVVNPFDAPTLEKLMHDFVAAEQIKIGQIIHAVRTAVTGKSTGLGMFDTLAILGKSACLRRINRTLEQA